MKLKKEYYFLLAAICVTLIGFIAAYYSSYYENSIQGTHDRGMYGMLEEIRKSCLYFGTALFVGFVAIIVFSKHKNIKD
ncbi:hypothetical protein EMN47_05950 [Prolixibacteraceae bacterium JC049]|nr:hypothetical protein [Prolixibacteraceae bacterium JC049]